MHSISKKGVALLTVLMLGALFSVLVASLLLLLGPAYRSHRLQQQALQASWNARAGLEYYRAGRLPELDSKTRIRQLQVRPGDKSQVCQFVWNAKGDLVLTGVSGSVCRRFLLPAGNLDRIVEIGGR